MLSKMKLEDKLRIVKDKVYERLTKGSMESVQYCKFIEEKLVEQGLVDKVAKYGLNDLTIDLLPVLNRKLSVKFDDGLKKGYQRLSNSELSGEAKEDVDNYQRLFKSTKNYLDEKIGSEEVFDSDFSKMAKDYLVDNFPENFPEFDKRFAMAKITGSLYIHFNVKEKPKMINGYNPDDVKDALDKI